MGLAGWLLTGDVFASYCVLLFRGIAARAPNVNRNTVTVCGFSGLVKPIGQSDAKVSRCPRNNRRHLGRKPSDGMGRVVCGFSPPGGDESAEPMPATNLASRGESREGRNKNVSAFRDNPSNVSVAEWGNSNDFALLLELCVGSV